MGLSAISQLLDRLRRSALLQEGAEQTDGQLLEAFIARRDAQALEVLVCRHAPMVWGVCRRALGSRQDAEDAFQATFLVLVRKAASIRDRELLASWLYGVARRTAGKARHMAGIRSSREQSMGTPPEPQSAAAPDSVFGPEELRLLDEELGRLPEKYRAAIVLCDLKGSSRVEAARQLGLAAGTVGSRLARGREMLARRLARRGLGVSAPSVAAVWSQQALAALPDALRDGTIKAVSRMAAGQAATAGLLSTKVITLTEAVLRATALAKLKAASLVLLIAALVLSGVMAACHLLANRPIEDPEIPAVDHAQADTPVLVVAAFYPGANAQVVADTVAAPLEKLINEVEGIVRIESTSDNEGQYTAHLYFRANTDLELAIKRVKISVWRAEPVFPEAVLKNKVTVKVGKAEAVPSKVTIAIIDRWDMGWEESLKVADAVVKRLAAADALRNPQVFPQGEKQFYIDIDRTKCASLGVPMDDVCKALEAACGPVEVHGLEFFPARRFTSAHTKAAMKPEELKKVVVRDKVTLGDVAVIKEVYGPAAVYREGLSPVIRITGTPPEGKSVAEAAARCVELAEAELKRSRARGFVFAVENQSAK